jgi:general secretion pathway protein B
VSLILDALRKADAERERGSVPSLHSQPVAPTSAGVPRKPVARPSWLWIAIGVAIGLAGAATWVMVGSGGSQTSATTPMPSAPPAPPVGAPGASPAVTAAPGTGPTSAPAATARYDSQPVAEPAPWRQPEERKDARADGKGGAPAPTVLSAAPAAEAPVMSREQLPPNIRSELPQFAVGGSIYSSNPAARSLIVNGQLYREKDRLTQDLTLEEIKLKAAVFSFRGYRFEVLF